jgi:DivIVA domain-containing protein
MDHDDPEKRISELERRLADPRAVGNPGDNQFPFASAQVHNVAFSDASRGRGYHRDEVDAFVDRVEAMLRDPTVRGGVYPADLDDVAFSKPPIGKLGYSEAEVDAFLDRVKTELRGRVPGQGPKQPGQGPEEPIRCLLYRYASSDQQTPVLAIDVGKDALRVIDLNGNALIASVSLAEVTAQPAQYSGTPVLVVDGPGLETLTIIPHPPPGQWRTSPKSKKPAYLVVEAEWLVLAEKFGLASDLVDERGPQTFLEHVDRFAQERGTRAPTSWRTPLVLGVILVVPGCIFWLPVPLLIGVLCLIVAAVAWRLKWET